MNLASGSQREKEAASAEGCERHCAASVARTAKANAETPGSPYYNANANAYRMLDLGRRRQTTDRRDRLIITRTRTLIGSWISRVPLARRAHAAPPSSLHCREANPFHS